MYDNPTLHYRDVADSEVEAVLLAFRSQMERYPSERIRFLVKSILDRLTTHHLYVSSCAKRPNCFRGRDDGPQRSP
jgi:hypothetical protein